MLAYPSVRGRRLDDRPGAGEGRGTMSPTPDPRSRTRTPVLGGLVADGLDVVAVGIEDVAAIVGGVVPAHSGCAVVGPACLDGRSVEGVHLCPTLSPQGDV